MTACVRRSPELSWIPESSSGQAGPGQGFGGSPPIRHPELVRDLMRNEDLLNPDEVSPLRSAWLNFGRDDSLCEAKPQTFLDQVQVKDSGDLPPIRHPELVRDLMRNEDLLDYLFLRLFFSLYFCCSLLYDHKLILQCILAWRH